MYLTIMILLDTTKLAFHRSLLIDCLWHVPAGNEYLKLPSKNVKLAPH